jgi:hypothetical protein
MRWIDSTRDIRYAGRALSRTPGFTITAVFTLAVAIGAVAAIFTVVHAVLLTSLPFANADRLVSIAAAAPGSDFPPEFGVSAEFVVEYQEQSRLLEDVAVYNAFTSTLRVGDRVERIPMSAPTNSCSARSEQRRSSDGCRSRPTTIEPFSSAIPCGRRGSAAIRTSSAARSRSPATCARSSV